MKKTIVIILLVLNSLTLMGQIYPEGAPPFARTVNILTLSLDLIFLLSLIRYKKLNDNK